MAKQFNEIPSDYVPGTGALRATFHTNKGDITIKLFEDRAPKTVANFVGLATGKREWTDTDTFEPVSRPYYDGLIFHRVIPGFMIQGGCALGNGRGGPGYRFADEFHPELRHSKAGMLSMANAGPDTNGGQFFLTVAATPHLDNRHAVFGEVIEGLDLAIEISNVPRNRSDRPNDDVVIHTLSVYRA